MDVSSYEEDNLKNCRIEGDIADEAKDEPCWLGIDEAGRGPVLGPMVYGTCFSPLKYKKDVEQIGFADSKTLNEEKREELFVKLNDAKDKIGWIIDILSPHTISTGMLGRSKYNLNAMSHDTAISLIQAALDKGVNVKEVYVDTVGPPEKYQAKLKGIFPKLDITVAKKADATYAIVSAASICAKVGRDKAVKTWKFSENIELKDDNYGSGYPGDPATKRFMVDTLDNVFGFPKFVRFSWSTASNIIDNKAVRINWPDDEEDENSEPAAKKPRSVSNFFQPTPESLSRKKHRFFNDRHLKAVTHF